MNGQRMRLRWDASFSSNGQNAFVAVMHGKALNGNLAIHVDCANNPGVLQSMRRCTPTYPATFGSAQTGSRVLRTKQAVRSSMHLP